MGIYSLLATASSAQRGWAGTLALVPGGSGCHPSPPAPSQEGHSLCPLLKPTAPRGGTADGLAQTEGR